MAKKIIQPQYDDDQPFLQMNFAFDFFWCQMNLGSTSSFSVLWIPLLEAAQPDFAGRCLCPTLASVHPFSVVPNPFIGPHIVFNPLLHFFPHLIPIWFHFKTLFCTTSTQVQNRSVNENERQGCCKKLPRRLRPPGLLSCLSWGWQGAQYRQAACKPQTWNKTLFYLLGTMMILVLPELWCCTKLGYFRMQGKNSTEYAEAWNMLIWETYFLTPVQNEQEVEWTGIGRPRHVGHKGSTLRGLVIWCSKVLCWIFKVLVSVCCGIFEYLFCRCFSKSKRGGGMLGKFHHLVSSQPCMVGW